MHVHTILKYVKDSADLSYLQSNRCCPVHFSKLFLACHVQHRALN